jgi:hypothetical protein
MDIDIKEAITPSGLQKFVHFANDLYKGDPYWVPFPLHAEIKLLRQDKNPSFKYCEARYFLAYKEGKIVGRVAAILNHSHIDKWGQKYMRFGWMEFIDDPKVSAALVRAVEDWAAEKKMTAVHGPLGFTDLDRNGFLVEGFNEVGTLTANHTLPYYPRHMENLGYHKDIDWLEYEITVPDQVDREIVEKAEQIRRSNNLHLLQPRSKADLLPYTNQIFELMNTVYRDKYGTVPLDSAQINAYMKYFFPLANHRFISVVLDEADRVVAFSISYPSLTKTLQRSGGRLIPSGVLKLANSTSGSERVELMIHGVADSYAGMGISVVVMNAMLQNFHKYGIKVVESNPEMEDNESLPVQWKFFTVRQHKRRRCYIKQLAA